MEQKSPLGDFLISLSDDDAALEEYRRDRHSFVDRSDLADDHKNALKSGDLQKIRQIVREEVAAAGNAKPFFVIVFAEARRS